MDASPLIQILISPIPIDVVAGDLDAIAAGVYVNGVIIVVVDNAIEYLRAVTVISNPNPD